MKFICVIQTIIVMCKYVLHLPSSQLGDVSFYV